MSFVSRSFSVMSVSFVLFVLTIFISVTTAQTNNDCSCGFYDPTTQTYFTDSAIVYFNESTVIPTDAFIPESYVNKYEKGWNTIYRQGANVSNLELDFQSSNSNASQTLQLFIDPTTKDHLVTGAELRSLRQDMFYGSFRSYLQAPARDVPGTALSMTLHFNDSQSIDVDLMNTDNPENGWVGLLNDGEFPDREFGVNYTVLANSTNKISAWNYTEYRVDWTPKTLTYYIGGKIFRTVHKNETKNYPITPAPLRIKHWSVGNMYSTQGPPKNRTVAEVGWVRTFFNSSLTTLEEQEAIAFRCPIEKTCSTEDMTLRGSSPHTPETEQKWKQAPNKMPRRIVPKIILLITGSISGFLLLNAIARRIPNPFKKTQPPLDTDLKEKYSPSPSPSASSASDRDIPLKSGAMSVRTFNSDSAPNPTVSWRNFFEGNPGVEMERESMDRESMDQSRRARRDLGKSAVGWAPPKMSDSVKDGSSSPRGVFTFTRETKPSEPSTPVSEHAPQVIQVPEPMVPMVKRQRVDYLAGSLAFACICVTAIHFALTFTPALINPGADTHYGAEKWTRKTIAQYVLNLNCVGIFLTTSTRFLVWNYLRTGELRGVAEKTVRQPLRLLLPVGAIALIEYFFMDSGATNWLEYLPSVTWSTWPFVTVPKNFGDFVSTMMELAYLIPNAAPQITFNYCTGVLWTIPVQLQGAWVTLLGVIVIFEVKTPWKRFSYYTFCVLVHWYALSWGTYFYCAMMLADLDINFKYRKWLYARPGVYYPLIITCILLTFGGLSIDTATQWTGVNYATFEYGVHPDAQTGLAIMYTPRNEYPPYYIPKLNGLVFTIGMQALVEISPLVQKMFSVKALTYIFPHIFTIYLIHGFVFWTLGSTIFVYLAQHGLDYWKIVAVGAISCYAALLLGVPLLTPIVDSLGKSVTLNMWTHSHEVPPPRKPTLHPFPPNFLFIRQDVIKTAGPEGQVMQDGHVVSTMTNNPFTKFVTSLKEKVMAKASRQSWKRDLHRTRAQSLSQPVLVERKVGWRTAGLPKNVSALRRNNSQTSRPPTWKQFGS